MSLLLFVLILHPAYCVCFAHAQVLSLFNASCASSFCHLPPLLLFIVLCSRSLICGWQGTPHIMIRLSMSYLLVLCTSVCTCMLVHFWHYVMLVNSRILCLCCLVYMSYTRGTNDLFINVLFSHIMFMLPGIYVLYPWY